MNNKLVLVFVIYCSALCRPNFAQEKCDPRKLNAPTLAADDVRVFQRSNFIQPVDENLQTATTNLNKSTRVSENAPETIANANVLLKFSGDKITGQNGVNSPMLPPYAVPEYVYPYPQVAPFVYPNYYDCNIGLPQYVKTPVVADVVLPKREKIVVEEDIITKVNPTIFRPTCFGQQVVEEDIITRVNPTILRPTYVRPQVVEEDIITKVRPTYVGPQVVEEDIVTKVNPAILRPAYFAPQVVEEREVVEDKTVIVDNGLSEVKRYVNHPRNIQRLLDSALVPFTPKHAEKTKFLVSYPITEGGAPVEVLAYP